MIGLTTLNTLFIIVFLNSLSVYLITPVLAPHFSTLSGTHIVLGLLVSGNCICRIFAKSFFFAAYEKSLWGSQKYSLLFSLLIILITYAILTITSSKSLILLCRFVYRLFDGTLRYCKNLSLNLEETRNVKLDLVLFDIIDGIGIIFGSIISGYLYEYNKQFSYNSITAGVITILNIVLVLQIKTDNRIIQTNTQTLRNFMDEVMVRIRKLKELDFNYYWDILVLKIVYITSTTLYFTKFAFLFAAKHNVGTIILGFITAYHHILAFIFQSTEPDIKNYLFNYNNNIQTVFEYSLMIFGIALPALYYAPTYECMLIILIPIILTRTILDNNWNGSIQQSNPDFIEDQTTIENILKITVPVIFSFICNTVGVSAFKILAPLPLIVCFITIRKRLIAEHNNDGDKKD